MSAGPFSQTEIQFESSAITLGPGTPYSATPTAVNPTSESRVLIAQQFDQDVLGDINEGFSKFVESGQVWALLIGLVVGFVVRGITR